MAEKMTSRQRFGCVFEHKEPDRVPILDTPWSSTLERWRQEGMPADVELAEFFGWDRIGSIGIDNSPRYPTRTVEETDEYIIATSSWGTTMKNFKHTGSVPEFIDHAITDPDSWRHDETIAPMPSAFKKTRSSARGARAPGLLIPASAPGVT